MTETSGSGIGRGIYFKEIQHRGIFGNGVFFNKYTELYQLNTHFYPSIHPSIHLSMWISKLLRGIKIKALTYVKTTITTFLCHPVLLLKQKNSGRKKRVTAKWKTKDNLWKW